MIVADSGPLIALARIGQLDLLPALFQRVLVPRAVHSEVVLDPGLPGARELAEAAWSETIDLRNHGEVDRMLFWLDLGESEAIVLARERSLPVLIDERRGRRVAESLGVEHTGTVGVLIAAKHAGLIEDVASQLEALRTEGFHLSEELREAVLQLAGEPKE